MADVKPVWKDLVYAMPCQGSLYMCVNYSFREKENAFFTLQNLSNCITRQKRRAKKACVNSTLTKKPNVSGGGGEGLIYIKEMSQLIKDK